MSTYEEESMTITCDYPDALHAFLYVMPAQIDDPQDSDIATYFFPNHLTVYINIATREVTLSGNVYSDAAGLILEAIDNIN